jgi:hypothetical protein
LNDEPESVLGVQGALAETAASYFELPAVAAQRVLVVATATRTAETAGRFLDAIAGAPWIRVRTASDAATTFQAKDQPIPLPIAKSGDRPPLAAARAARRELATLGKVLGDEGQPAELLDRYILAAESADWISDPQRGSILASAARGTAERTLGLVRIPGRQVTLTSRIAQIPVTIINDTAQADGSVLPARVQVKLDSTKIRFPEGASRELTVDSHVSTVTFRAETRVTGSFPLTVLLQTPDGSDTVGEGIIIVRSTAVSAVTLLLTGGGVLVLFVTWARRVFRARKQPAPG